MLRITDVFLQPQENRLMLCLREACFLERNAIQFGLWDCYPFQGRFMPAFERSANYQKQHYSCNSAVMWVNVFPEVRSGLLITTLHSTQSQRGGERRELLCFTWGREPTCSHKSSLHFFPPWIMRQEDVQQPLVSRHMPRRRPRCLSQFLEFAASPWSLVIM